MPFMTIEMGKTLTDEQKKAIAEAMGTIIAVVPGKTRDNLMLSIHDGLYMAFGDTSSADCLHINIRMYKQSARADRERLVAACADYFVKTLALDPDNIYTTIEELDDWGVGGRYV